MTLPHQMAITLFFCSTDAFDLAFYLISKIPVYHFLSVSLSLSLFFAIFAASFGFWLSHTHKHAIPPSHSSSHVDWDDSWNHSLTGWLSSTTLSLSLKCLHLTVSLSLLLAKGQCFSIWISRSLYFSEHPPPNQPSPSKKRTTIIIIKSIKWIRS